MPNIKKNNDGTTTLEGVRLLWPNLGGHKARFNAEGDRNFNVVIPPEFVDDMIRDGWKIRKLEGNDYRDDEYILKVKVNYNSRRPPRINLVTSRNRTHLPEEMVGLVDELELTGCDVRISPYERRNDDGVKTRTAYLVNMFAIMYEDELDQKYAHLESTNDRLALPAGDTTDATAALPAVAESNVIQGEVLSSSYDAWPTNDELRGLAA